MNDQTKTPAHGRTWMSLILIAGCGITFVAGCERKQTSRPAVVTNTAPPKPAKQAPIEPPTRMVEPTPELIDQLRAKGGAATKPGIAAIVLMDTSGSMNDAVRDSDGRTQPKIQIARRAARSIVQQTESFAREQPGEPTLIGLYEFSARHKGQPECRPVLPLAAPNAAAVQAAVDALRPEGGTPIGEALIRAKKDLDKTGLMRQHILVITDGENTSPVEPGVVVKAINSLPEDQRPGIYFVAFDVDARIFARAKDAGALILPAANGKELQERLDFIMGNKILLEK